MTWFGNRSKQPPIRTLVGEGTLVVGELRFIDGLRIDGDVHGDVIADNDGPSMLVISEKARVRGKVKAAHVIINGEVQGPVLADGLLVTWPTSAWKCTRAPPSTASCAICAATSGRCCGSRRRMPESLTIGQVPPFLPQNILEQDDHERTR
jgi:hypothetical protein